MLKLSAILFALTLTAYAQDELLDVEGTIVSRKREYHYTFEQLCPNVPTKQSLKCIENHKVANHISLLLSYNAEVVEVIRKIVDLAKCNLETLTNQEISLEIYCYLEGLKEQILKRYNMIKDENSDEAKEMLAEVERYLNSLIDKTTRYDIKTFFQMIIDHTKDVFDDLTT